MGKLIFGCGCQFDINGSEDISVKPGEKLPTGIDVDIYNIPHNCPRTWNLMAEGKTKGVFQLEGHLGKTWATKIKPSNMEELAALVSLLRPGCLRAMSGDPPKSMTERFKDRKLRLEDVEYMHPIMESILGKTYGVLVYQESAMQLSVTLAGFDLQQADVLRKAIGKKKADIMASIRQDFIDGCDAQAIVNKQQAEEIFGWIQESQRYSFNKSHAVSYGEGGYWTAYLKAHFPVQFFCSFLHGAQWKQDVSEEVNELVNDAKLLDVDIRVPDFKDQNTITYIKDNSVYFGFDNIKHIGSASLVKLQKLIQSISKPVDIWSWMDYLIYCGMNVASTVNEALISCGALDYMKKSRTSMLYELEIFRKLTSKEAEWIATQHQQTPFPGLVYALIACAPKKKDGGGCHNVNRSSLLQDMIKMLKKPPHSIEDTADFIAWSENKYLGASITCSKVDGCMKAVEANSTCREVMQGKNGYTVVAAEILRLKVIRTKHGKTPGQKMAFLTIGDHSGAIDDVVAFPDTWIEFSNMIYEGNTLLIHGEKGSKSGWIIKKVWQI